MANEAILSSYWRNKTVLITGASSGLGMAVVRALAPYHVTFGLLSRRKEPMVALAESLKHGNSKFWIKTCDVRDREDVNEAVQEFKDYAGKLDVVWVNAGISARSSLRKWNWERIDACLQTNLIGALNTIKASLDVMLPYKLGTIVAIGSVASMRGMPGHSVYSLTKISLQYMMEAMAVEAPEIQFTMIHPGFVETPLTGNSPSRNRPFLMMPSRAAKKMISAVANKRSKFIFPWQMNILYHVMRIIPSSLFVKVGTRYLERSRWAPKNYKT